jgi:Ca2+-binding RTX toxin-like protein
MRLTSGNAEWIADLLNPAGTLVRGLGGNDTFINNSDVGNNNLFGDEGNDSFISSAPNDWLNGGTGDDTFRLQASHSAGTINAVGGDGNDTIFGDHVLDTDMGSIAAIGGRGDDLIIFRGANPFWGNVADGGAGNDTLVSMEVSQPPGFISLGGGRGDDLLEGKNGTEVLDGGAGNDTIVGGKVLVGGGGHDKFFFTEKSIAHDAIVKDFGKGDSLWVPENEEFTATVDGADVHLHFSHGVVTLESAAHYWETHGGAAQLVFHPDVL